MANGPRRGRLELHTLLVDLIPCGVNPNFDGDLQRVPFRVPKHDLELDPRRQRNPKAHRRPIPHCGERRRPWHRGRRHQGAAVGALLVALVEPRHGVVGGGDGGVGVVEGEGDVGVAHAFVLHAVGEFEVEGDGVVAGGGGGGGVEGGEVEALDGAGGLGGAEAEPHEEGGEARGD